MDDIIICAVSEEECMQKTKRVLETAANYNLKLKWKNGKATNIISVTFRRKWKSMAGNRENKCSQSLSTTQKP